MILSCLLALVWQPAMKDADVMNEIFMLTNLINFVCLYNNYLTGLVCTVLANIVLLVSRGLHYGDEWYGEAMQVGFFLMILQCIAITLIHLFITKLSFMIVEKKVSLQGKNELLANLKGRVIVLDKEEKTVLF
jgi:hypothetical protein